MAMGMNYSNLVRHLKLYGRRDEIYVGLLTHTLDSLNRFPKVFV